MQRGRFSCKFHIILLDRYVRAVVPSILDLTLLVCTPVYCLFTSSLVGASALKSVVSLSVGRFVLFVPLFVHRQREKNRRVPRHPLTGLSFHTQKINRFYRPSPFRMLIPFFFFFFVGRCNTLYSIQNIYTYICV